MADRGNDGLVARGREGCTTSLRARRHTLGDLLHRSAVKHPDKLAIACGAVRWTYAEFDRVSDCLAAGLAEQGVTKGSRVAILARNSHAFAAMRFALARLGAVLVPINFMLKAEEIAFILRGKAHTRESAS